MENQNPIKIEHTNEYSVVIKQNKSLDNILLITSIIAIIGSWVPVLNFFSIMLGIIGLILGAVLIVKAIKKTKNTSTPATIGIILSFLTLFIAFGTIASISEKFHSSDPHLVSGVETKENSSKNSSSNESDGKTNQTKNEAPASNNQKDEPTKKEEDTTKKETNKEYNIGDVVSIDNIEVSAVKIDKNYNAGKYRKAKSGNEFIKVSVKINNKSKSDIDVSSYDFKVLDSNGLKHEHKWYHGGDDELNHLELAPNGHKEGSIIFEVPKNDKNLKLIFKPFHLFDDREVVINL